MRAMQADYGYTIETAGDRYQIEYGQMPRLWHVVMSTVILIVPVGLLLEVILKVVQPILEAAFPFMSGIPLTAPIIVLLFATMLSIACGQAIGRFIASRRSRPRISLSPQFIETNGKRYERRHITQIYVKGPGGIENAHPVMADNSGYVAIGASGALGVGGIAGAGLQAGADGIRNTVGLVSHGVLGIFNFWRRSRGSSIWMNYGAKPARLAQRLESQHADLLAQDLVRLITAR